MPWQTFWCWHVERMIPGGDRAHSLTYFAEQMERAVGLARSAGGRFVLPLAAALFAFWNSKRGYTLIWPGDASPSFDTAAELQGLFRVDDDFVCVVLEALQGLDVPRELDGDSAPMFDTAYWHGFPQVRVWIYLLRMIVVARWRRGRGWAGRPITRRGIDGV